MGIWLSREAACLLRSLTWASRGFSCCSFAAMARRAASCCSSRSFTCTAMTTWGAVVSCWTLAQYLPVRSHDRWRDSRLSMQDKYPTTQQVLRNSYSCRLSQGIGSHGPSSIHRGQPRFDKTDTHAAHCTVDGGAPACQAGCGAPACCGSPSPPPSPGATPPSRSQHHSCTPALPLCLARTLSAGPPMLRDARFLCQCSAIALSHVIMGRPWWTHGWGAC